MKLSFFLHAFVPLFKQKLSPRYSRSIYVKMTYSPNCLPTRDFKHGTANVNIKKILEAQTWRQHFSFPPALWQQRDQDVRYFPNLQAFQSAPKGTIRVRLYIRDTETVSHVDPSAVKTLLHVKRSPAGSPAGFWPSHIDTGNGNFNSHLIHQQVPGSFDARLYKKN